jgi:hypothetical protein
MQTTHDFFAAPSFSLAFASWHFSNIQQFFLLPVRFLTFLGLQIYYDDNNTGNPDEMLNYFLGAKSFFLNAESNYDF